MLQEIAPHVYQNTFFDTPPSPSDYAVVWQQDGVLLRKSESGLELPKIAELPDQRWQPLFRMDEAGYYLCTSVPEQLPEGCSFVQPRTIMDEPPRHTAFAVAVAGSLARWYGANRYCGACAAPMEPSKTERALVCPQCGNTVYPKICPAVIVAVTDGDRLLLTRYAGRSFKRWALVAGFNEIGETIEDTVRREVMEETGLQVTDLRFYRSQPWVLTDSLLMGFFCRVVGGTSVTLQEDELAEAVWFERDELPENHSKTSLTGEMIERFRVFGAEGF